MRDVTRRRGIPLLSREAPALRRPPLTCGRGGRGAALRGGGLHGRARPGARRGVLRGLGAGIVQTLPLRPPVPSPGLVPLCLSPRPAALPPRHCLRRPPARSFPGCSHPQSRGLIAAGGGGPGRGHGSLAAGSVPVAAPGTPLSPRHRPRHAPAGEPQ